MVPRPGHTNDRDKRLRAITVDRWRGPRPCAEAAFSIWKDFLFALGAPSTGTTLAEDPVRFATNVGTVYSPNAPVDVNRTVQRVPAAVAKPDFGCRFSDPSAYPTGTRGLFPPCPAAAGHRQS